MRSLKDRFFLAMAVLTTALVLHCSPQLASSSIATNLNHSSHSQTDQLHLEIRDYCVGSCNRPTRLIHFRFNQTGNVEFEVPVEVDINDGPKQIGASKLRFQIDREAIMRLMDLIEQTDLAIVEREYEGRNTKVEAVQVTAILIIKNGEKKEVYLKNYSGDERGIEIKYPASIVELMRVVGEIRERLQLKAA